jgi:adenylosuccinate synthase
LKESDMPGTALIGLQWGDEGKGKVIDHLAARADVVARFQGGGNAGHTVVVGDRKVILHHLPSGILHPGKTCVIGPGLVVDPDTLSEELAMVEGEGVEVAGRVFLDLRTHIVLPHHRFQDAAAESRRGAAKIGTTGRGIGPAYGDKMARIGLRMGDLLESSGLEDKIQLFVGEKRRLFGAEWDEERFGEEALMAFCRTHAERLAPFILDSVEAVNRALDDGRKVLFEGAQGTLLDIDLGSYPFVTSSNTTVGGLFHGAGVSPRRIDSVVGVTKAYMTRVGAGDFPQARRPQRPRRGGHLHGVRGERGTPDLLRLPSVRAVPGQARPRDPSRMAGGHRRREGPVRPARRLPEIPGPGGGGPRGPHPVRLRRARAQPDHRGRLIRRFTPRGGDA